MQVPDTGPFFHGTKADLRVGDLLCAGFTSNYKDGLVMNHIDFTALSKGAGLAAEIARGSGRPRVYIVEQSRYRAKATSPGAVRRSSPTRPRPTPSRGACGSSRAPAARRASAARAPSGEAVW